MMLKRCSLHLGYCFQSPPTACPQGLCANGVIHVRLVAKPTTIRLAETPSKRDIHIVRRKMPLILARQACRRWIQSP